MQESTGATLSVSNGDDGTPGEHSRSGVLRQCVAAAVLTFAADQGSKYWALQALDDAQYVPLVGDLLGLRLIFNPGAAFSIGTSMTWVMTLVALAVTIGVAVMIRRVGSRGWALALGLLLGGSLGNLFDRFFRDPGPLRGHVVDFIDYAGLFVGNVADIAIVVAAGLLVWLVFTNTGIDGQPARHAADQEESDG